MIEVTDTAIAKRGSARTLVTVASAAVLAISSAATHAQTWQRVIGSEDPEFCQWTRLDSDGGYISTGLRLRGKQGDQDIYIIKQDADGVLEWDLLIDYTIAEAGHRIEEYSDREGYVVAAEVDCTCGGIFLAGITDTGTVSWSRVFNGTDFVAEEGLGPALVEIPGDGWIVSGRIQVTAGAAQLPVLYRVSPVGSLIWGKVYSDDRFGSDTFADIFDIEYDAANDEFLAVGYTSDDTVGNKDTLLMRLDSAGDVIWARSYQIPGDSNEYGRGLDLMPSGDILITGRQDRTGTLGTYIMRTNSTGNRIFYEKIPGFTGTNSIELSAGGRAAIAGRTDNSGTDDAAIVRFDVGTGAFLSGMRYGTATTDEFARGLDNVPGRGFHVVGGVDGAGFAFTDVYSIQTDRSLASGCRESDYVPIFDSDTPAARDLDITVGTASGTEAVDVTTTRDSMESVICEDDGCDLVFTVGGTCPSAIDLSVTGATPSGEVLVIYAFAPGDTPIPPGVVCEGTRLGLNATAKLGLRGFADASGNFSQTVSAPPVACGGFVFLQVLDVDSCCTSNVEQTP